MGTGTASGGSVSIGFRLKGGRADLGHLLGQPSVGIVGILYCGISGGDGFNAVVVIVGVGCGDSDTVGSLCQLGQIVLCVVFIADAVGIICTFFLVPHQPVGQVVVVGGCPSGGRVDLFGKVAVVIVLIRYGVTVFVGIRGASALGIIRIVYPVPVSVGKGLQVQIVIVCITGKDVIAVG